MNTQGDRQKADVFRRARERALKQRQALRREAERCRRARERVAALGLGPKLPWRRRGP